MERRGIGILLIKETIILRYKRFLIAVITSVSLLASMEFAAADDAVEERKIDEKLSQQPLIQPNVKRRVIDKVAIDTENLELGFLFGTYSAEDWGANPVTGFRLAYHISEDVFFEVTAGQTETNKTSYELIESVTLVAEDERTLTYYNLNVGFNLLPGEVFIGDSWAFNISLYFLGGIGTTTFAGEELATVVTGGGLRILLTDWMAFHLDVRNHVFRQSIIPGDETKNNLEFFTSLTFYL